MTIHKNVIKYKILESDPLLHFTTTIDGGVSEGNYGTFNLSFYSGDDSANVQENRARLTKELGVDSANLFVPFQTHQDKICVVDADFLLLDMQAKEEALRGVDALITDRKNICIGITTADCVPLLIYDATNGVLAAVHAGWKSCVVRIAAKTVMRMEKEFGSQPSALRVAIGPSISPESFEVGDEVGDTFVENGFDLSNISYRNDKTGKLHINLREACRVELMELGVMADNIECANLCTYSRNDLFFSARRQGLESGRMITGGVLL